MKTADYYRNFAEMRNIVFTENDAREIEYKIYIPSEIEVGQIVDISINKDLEIVLNLP